MFTSRLPPGLSSLPPAPVTATAKNTDDDVTTLHEIEAKAKLINISLNLLCLPRKAAASFTHPAAAAFIALSCKQFTHEINSKHIKNKLMSRKVYARSHFLPE